MASMGGRSRSQPTVCVIGAGVTGVTTAIVLRLLGYAVTIVSEKSMPNVAEASASPDPTFASLFPAASIIPHTVDIGDLPWHVDVARQFFGALNFSSDAGVRVQRHFELFEDPTDVAPYAPHLAAFDGLPDDGTDAPTVPRRQGCPKVWGWSFDCYFAEMPVYRRWLMDRIADLGAEIESRRLDPHDVDRLDADVIVNCAGYGSAHLFDARRELTLVKGILVHVDPPTAALMRGGGSIGSYNYSPTATVYPAAGPLGRADVYFYPRLDSWVMGGTRIRGRLDEHGTWIGDDVLSPTRRIGDVDVPVPILELNAELIRGLTGVDVSERSMRAVVGYRCARDPVRLEAESRGNRVIVHNYGHGGSGVTLSWSCAVRVAALISEMTQPAVGGIAAQPVLRLIQELVDGALDDLDGDGRAAHGTS